MSIQELMDFGMVETNDFMFPYSKDLSVKKSSDEDDEDCKIELAIYVGNNKHEVVLCLPDGIVYLNAQNIEDVKAVEKLILGYEPHW